MPIRKFIEQAKKYRLKRAKILLLSSYSDVNGKDTIDTRLEDIKGYLSDNVPIDMNMFLASDKKLKDPLAVKEHIHELIENSDIIVFTVFKDAAGMALGAELSWILDDTTWTEKSILCIQEPYEMSDLFTTQSGYIKLPKITFNDPEQLKKKLRHAIIRKLREIWGSPIY